MGDCPECEFIGNAVVGSTQRGIVLHSTHNSKVIRNVVLGAKGAHLYIEEGTELNNTVQVGDVCYCYCYWYWYCYMVRLYLTPLLEPNKAHGVPES
jgi:parallel beta-helix repeat protein